MMRKFSFHDKATLSKYLFLPSLFFILLALLGFNSSCKNDRNTNGNNPDIIVNAEGKKDMFLITDRPINLETPLKYFKEDFTPNDVFFVRWHNPVLPDSVNEDTFRLHIVGHVDHELAISLSDLKTKFKQDTIVALAACAGNARSFFDPRVPGGQWKNGAMGNAKWTGVKLKDILSMAGVKKDAYEVSFNGLDKPSFSSVPDFEKSLKIDHAMDGEVMVAYEMNGDPLPKLNGYPLKLVVPGWYATYWVGMLSNITVHADTFNGFWMKKAYQVPKDVRNGNERPDSLAKNLEPVSKMDIRSIFVAPEPGSILKVNETTELQGLAFDGGDRIAKVEISMNDSSTWVSVNLDPELGKYSWRRWRYLWKPLKAGTYQFKVRATNAIGETQSEHQWNRSGYLRNEIEVLEIIVDQ